MADWIRFCFFGSISVHPIGSGCCGINSRNLLLGGAQLKKEEPTKRKPPRKTKETRNGTLSLSLPRATGDRAGLEGGIDVGPDRRKRILYFLSFSFLFLFLFSFFFVFLDSGVSSSSKPDLRAVVRIATTAIADPSLPKEKKAKKKGQKKRKRKKKTPTNPSISRYNADMAIVPMADLFVLRFLSLFLFLCCLMLLLLLLLLLLSFFLFGWIRFDSVPHVFGGGGVDVVVVVVVVVVFRFQKKKPIRLG